MTIKSEGFDKMKSKILRRVAAVASALLLSFTAFGCGGTVIGGEDDKDKTYLYLLAYDGGYGVDWLEKTAARFEEKYKDYRIGDKVGVKVDIEATRDTGATVFSKMAVQNKDVYYLFFGEGGSYEDFLGRDYLLDLTDLLTENPEGQNHSILSTLDSQLKDYYRVSKDGSDKYYAAPYTTGFTHISYDEELFYNEGLFLTREYDEEGNEGNVDDYLIKKVSQNAADINKKYSDIVEEDGKKYVKTTQDDYLSMGPDGVYGTADDGMPRTFKEFFNLCKYMKNETEVAPFLFFGGNGMGEAYLRQALTNVAATVNGYENTKIQYTLNGTLDNLISVNEDGSISQLSPVTFTPDNAADNALEQFKQEGYYRAYEFGKKIFDNGNQYCHTECFGPNDQFHAQETFMLSVKDKNKAAFLVDGVWWEHEAAESAKNIADEYGEGYRFENRRFKLLNIPKYSLEDVGKKTTVVSGSSEAFILSKIDESKKELAKKFLQMSLTDESNAEYTATTGVPRPYNYTLTAEQYSSLTHLQKGLWDMKEGGAFVYRNSDSEWLKKNDIYSSYYSMAIYMNKTVFNNIIEIFSEKKFSAKEAFDGFYAFKTYKYGK